LDQLYNDPDYPDLRCAGGFSYACELCDKGTSCRLCDPADEGMEQDTMLCLDCVMGVLDPDARECFPRAIVKPYLGTRCCYDGPP
jgi:hypothetical protein